MKRFVTSARAWAYISPFYHFRIFKVSLHFTKETIDVVNLIFRTVDVAKLFPALRGDLGSSPSTYMAAYCKLSFRGSHVMSNNRTLLPKSFEM